MFEEHAAENTKEIRKNKTINKKQNKINTNRCAFHTKFKILIIIEKTHCNIICETFITFRNGNDGTFRLRRAVFGNVYLSVTQSRYLN